jgi:HTH-type transcriptional regulator / antitoxin HigA
MCEQGARFQPDWASPPGETIRDLMEEQGWTISELAARLDYSQKHAARLLAGEAAVTHATAGRLEKALGGNKRFWLTRETQYRQASNAEASCDARRVRRSGPTRITFRASTPASSRNDRHDPC